VVVDGLKDSAKRVGSIGDFIREQREQAQVSMRQLAKRAGVSNPYLSQIERGLRKPSAEILQQIAKGLRISAEQLYLHAGILETREGDPETIAVILADSSLDERQKQTLVQIYESFSREHAAIVAAAKVLVDVSAAQEVPASNGEDHSTESPEPVVHQP
jgi:transcriptional regulator with XRE-family HTH domain